MNSRLILSSLVIALALTAWLTTTEAQEDGACRAACQDQHSQCVDVCSEHSNPIECDANCRNEFEDCQARCQ